MVNHRFSVFLRGSVTSYTLPVFRFGVPAIVDKIMIKYTKVETVDVDDLDSIQHDLVHEALKWLDYRRPIGKQDQYAAALGANSQ